MSARRSATSSGLTLGEYALTWLATKGALTRATLDGYRSQIDRYVLPARIASMALADIRKPDLSLFVSKMVEAAPEHRRIVNQVISRLRCIFEDACDADLIGSNPMLKIKGIREDRGDADPFTLEECRRVMDAAEGWERSILAILLFAGLRPSEALALMWGDIDWAHRVICVRRTASRHGVHAPKTIASVRDVEIFETVYRELQQQRERTMRQDKDWWIFPSSGIGSNGTPISLDNFRKRHWRRIIERSGVPYRDVYQCRHTYATLMLAGNDVTWVARQLGHSSPTMTTERYARWNRAKVQSRGSGARIDEAMGVDIGSGEGGEGAIVKSAS